MATYNGARYLSEQLQSLASQSVLPCELVIGDDGSTDETLGILEEFRRCAPFPVSIHVNDVNLGYGLNFMETARRCKGDWIAFCDQDDVWLPSKLADVAKAIERVPGSCLFLQNAMISDGSLVPTGRAFPCLRPAGHYAANSQYGFWVWSGFLQTIDRRVVELWEVGARATGKLFPTLKSGHDTWTCLMANALGGIVVLDGVAARYRRHSETVTGSHSRVSWVERISKSRHATADHYDRLAEVAGHCADYMRCLSLHVENPSWARAFQDNAANFMLLETTQKLRARLYREPRVMPRLALIWMILSQGGYIGRPFTAMGLNSALKDATRALFG